MCLREKGAAMSTFVCFLLDADSSGSLHWAEMYVSFSKLYRQSIQCQIESKWTIFPPVVCNIDLIPQFTFAIKLDIWHPSWCKNEVTVCEHTAIKAGAGTQWLLTQSSDNRWVNICGFSQVSHKSMAILNMFLCMLFIYLLTTNTVRICLCDLRESCLLFNGRWKNSINMHGGYHKQDKQVCHFSSRYIHFIDLWL